MRIIEKGSPEYKLTCGDCGAKFVIEPGDVLHHKDISGVSVPYAECPVCKYVIDLEGYRGIPYAILHSETKKSNDLISW